MTIEGELVVRLERSGRRIRQVSVRSTRPYAASRVAQGRSLADAVAIVPSLFGICAHAQGAAAALAVEAASGANPAPPVLAARETAVRLETIQEYLWRILIDWPQALGHAAEIEPVASARRLIAPVLAHLAPLARRIDGDNGGEVGLAIPDATIASLRELAARHVYGGVPEGWLALTDRMAVAGWAAVTPTLPARLLGELLACFPKLGRSEVALMPPTDHEALLARVVPAMRSSGSFERAPTWAGAPVETGALARMQAYPGVVAFLADCGNSVATRMVARLAELAELLRWLNGSPADGGGSCWTSAWQLAGGEGLAAVQTARGLLLHRARVADGRVGEYQIVAPTEWNFHPEGALVRGLEHVEAADEAALARDARLVVQALDPCVACRVEFAGA